MNEPRGTALGPEAARLLLDHVDNMVCTLDLAGRFTSVNAAGERLTGYTAAELLGRPAATLIAPGRREDAARRFERRLAGDVVSDRDETVLVTRDGLHVPIEVSSTVFRADGVAVGVLGIVHDLTERQQAATALEHSERRFASLLEAAPDGVLIVDRQGEIVLVNARTEELFGYDRAELVGQSVDMLLPEASSEGHTRHRLRFVEDAHMRELSSGLELIAKRKDGHEFPVDINLSPLETASGLLVVASVRDVTERKQAEAALLESERRFRRSFVSAAIGIALVAPDGRFLEVNDSLCTLVDYPREQLLSLGFQDITHPDDLELDLDYVRRMLAGELRSYQMEKRYTRRDHEIVWALLSVSLITDGDGKPIHFVSQIQDITARKQAELERDRLRDELHHAQKLDAVGRLAGGIAHDFNNMLTAIRGYAELLVDRLEPGAGREEALQIKRAAEQAATLPQQLLAFGRKQALQPQVVDLNDVVRATGDLLRHLLTEVVTVVAAPGAHPARAHVDPSQIEHVLVNLALNARDAMPDGGSLTITTSDVSVDAALAREHGVAPGRTRCSRCGTRARAWTTRRVRGSSSRSSPPSRTGRDPASGSRVSTAPSRRAAASSA